MHGVLEYLQRGGFGTNFNKLAIGGGGDYSVLESSRSPPSKVDIDVSISEFRQYSVLGKQDIFRKICCNFFSTTHGSLSSHNSWWFLTIPVDILEVLEGVYV